MIFSRKATIIIVFALLFSAVDAMAQASRQTKEEYIQRYKHIAIDHMERYGIPASITMAQGILESDSGNSNLARRSNNHFGIKCKKDWKGDRVYHTDDAPDECFRKYDTVEESYLDHAEFLDQSPRYDSLFAYSTTDYHSWARGLKAAGYATAPDYAQRLVRIIEDNQLYLLDNDNGSKLYESRQLAEAGIDHNFAAQSSIDVITTVEGRIDPDNYRVVERTYNGYSVYAGNGTHYVIARDGDKFADIAKTFSLTERTLRKYNEIDPKSNADPIAGEIIYIEKKPKHWLGEQTTHKVSDGETLTSLSQEYGINKKSLARLNRIRPDATLQAGQNIRLK
ncbi:MAG: glucosaminidase domain-containing protein [Alistipes sp.]|nr:glucosaminidase domain-containing protein [Alistipes sp.]